MKIYYIYKKNTYAAQLAAYLHLGINNTTEYKNIQIEKMQFIYCGISKNNEEIYIANCGRNKKIFINLLKGIGKIYGIELKIIDLSKYDSFPYIFSSSLTKLNINNKNGVLFHENYF